MTEERKALLKQIAAEQISMATRNGMALAESGDPAMIRTIQETARLIVDSALKIEAAGYAELAAEVDRQVDERLK